MGLAKPNEHTEMPAQLNNARWRTVLVAGAAQDRRHAPFTLELGEYVRVLETCSAPPAQDHEAIAQKAPDQ